MGRGGAQKHECKLVSDCMDSAQEVEINAPLLDAIGYISEHGYVLVRERDRTITGIVTASDVGDQFMQLTGPYIWSLARLKVIYVGLYMEGLRSKN